MANRYAPYRARYLTREPRTLVIKFTSNGSTGEQTLTNTGPFNEGIVNVVASATGIYKVALGGSATSRDTYAHFAGIDICSDDPDTQLGEITNTECNHSTDPNITFQVTDTDDVDKYFGSANIVFLRLHFLDSTD